MEWLFGPPVPQAPTRDGIADAFALLTGSASQAAKDSSSHRGKAAADAAQEQEDTGSLFGSWFGWSGSAGQQEETVTEAPGSAASSRSGSPSRSTQWSAAAEVGAVSMLSAVARKGRPLAKTSAKHRGPLVSGDALGSDSEDDHRVAVHLGTRWSPFLSQEATVAADKAAARQRRQASPVDDGVEAEGWLAPLKSYEEEVLGLKATSSQKKRQPPLLALGHQGQSQALARFSHRVEAVSGDSTAVADDDERVNAKELARKDNCQFFELATTGPWRVSEGAMWEHGSDFGKLSGEHKAMTAVCQDYRMHVPDFDAEAEIMIVKGERAGLAFRANGLGKYHVLYVTIPEQSGADGPVVHAMDTGYQKLLGTALVSRHHWHQLRVRAIGTTLLFFVDGRQVAKDFVTTVESGLFGLWASDGHVRIRGLVVTSLKEYVEEVRRRDLLLESEHVRLKDLQRDMKVRLFLVSRSTRIIQQAFKFKLSVIKQRMQMYKQAEDLGRKTKIRDRKLLVWIALLSAFQRIDETMRQKDIQDLKHKQYLEVLEKSSPPPPPPPDRKPPDAADEELHYRYEAKRREYAHRWEAAGRTVLGMDKFEHVRNMESGPAEKEKRLIAEKCFALAQQAMSEQEHQMYLRKAWCLQNDWTSMDDPEALEAASRAAQQGGPASASGSKSARRARDLRPQGAGTSTL